ncbi:hypothetical protein [Lysobacter gummosus]|uniref:hypothetical protein n=1 Tax=Lysobacter gummosus TaxID=262324 RepID=UPI0036281F61
MSPPLWTQGHPSSPRGRARVPDGTVAASAAAVRPPMRIRGVGFVRPTCPAPGYVSSTPKWKASMRSRSRM